MPLGRLLPGAAGRPARVVSTAGRWRPAPPTAWTSPSWSRDVVVDQVARLLDLDPDEVDPG